MALLNERELNALLHELKDVNRTDKEGEYDYAFLEETIFPTLLPALIQLSENVEKQNMPPIPVGSGPKMPDTLNPLRLLSELLMRQHPNGVFKKETVYSKHLEKVASARRQQRLQRELLIAEIERKEKEEAMRQELERTEKEENERKEIEEARAQALTKKLADRALASAKEAVEMAGPYRNVLDLRESCMTIIGKYDFHNAESTADVNNMIFKETAKMLVTDSNATFVGVGRLDKPGLASTQLHYHIAADKKEFEPPEEDEAPPEGEEAGEKLAKVAPSPVISTRNLPPIEDELALVLKRGSGVTWEPVIDGVPHEDEEGEITREKPKSKYVADTKFTEGMFFFEEKRAGTYLAVPIIKDGEVIGVICGDTCDSILGSELQEKEAELFQAAARIMQKCLDYAEWRLLDARRETCTLRLELLVKDPRTLPTDLAEAFVKSMDLLRPGLQVAVGMFDTETTMRLLVSKMHDGKRTENEAVSSEDMRDHVVTIFSAKSKRDTELRRSAGGEHVISIGAPVLDANSLVSAVLYIAADPNSKPPHEDIFTFVQMAAELARPILLPPALNAMRVLSVLAQAGIGDPTNLYDTAGQLCFFYTRAIEVFIACSHGLTGLRILYQAGQSKMDKVVNRTGVDLAACDEAMRTQSSAMSAGIIAVPLLRKMSSGNSTSFGVIAIRQTMLPPDQQAAFEGVAAALSSALQVSEFRRKMVASTQMALESLLKRASIFKGGYLSFCDSGGQQVCAAITGKAVLHNEDTNEAARVGQAVPNSTKIQTQALQPGGMGPIVGFIGVAAKDVASEGISMYGDSAWTILQDVATTVATVSTVLLAEGIMMDTSSPDFAIREVFCVRVCLCLSGSLG
jgi:hypothetical protein